MNSFVYDDKCNVNFDFGVVFTSGVDRGIKDVVVDDKIKCTKHNVNTRVVDCNCLFIPTIIGTFMICASFS